MPKISIIVPIYNMEKYLPRCIDSILSQTFRDLEVILVNDGSTDNSENICREYAGRDNRIVALSKKNGGLSSARNMGLDAARGQYIGFVDSDDYIEKDMYELLYQNIFRYCADISICSFYTVYPGGRILHMKPQGIKKVFDKKEAIRTLLSREHFENHVWDRLYRKALFDDIRFPEKELYEDIAVTYRLFDRCNGIVYDSHPKYYYVQRNGSIVNSEFYPEKLKFVEACQRIVDFSKNRGGIYDEEAQSYYVLSNLWMMYEAAAGGNKEYRSILEVLCGNILRYERLAMASNYIRKSDKFSIFLLKNGISAETVSRIHYSGKTLINKFRELKYRIRKENVNEKHTFNSI
jgi:glycosyltransferase involved in cell wall biosynthesis